MLHRRRRWLLPDPQGQPAERLVDLAGADLDALGLVVPVAFAHADLALDVLPVALADADAALHVVVVAGADEHPLLDPRPAAAAVVAADPPDLVAVRDPHLLAHGLVDRLAPPLLADGLVDRRAPDAGAPLSVDRLTVRLRTADAQVDVH